MGSPIHAILRYLLEDEEDFKDVIMGDDAETYARMVWARARTHDFSTGQLVLQFKPDLTATARLAGKAMRVRVQTPRREPLLGPNDQNTRDCYFTWPSKEPFFVKTLARKIQTVLDAEPRRDLLDRLYFAVEAKVQHNPAFAELINGMVGDTYEGHPVDYRSMSMEDIEFWFELLKRYP